MASTIIPRAPLPLSGFIKAVGAAPRAVQYLEDAYDEYDRDRINYIENTVSDYEKALKHKADSIAREERRKLERF